MNSTNGLASFSPTTDGLPDLVEFIIGTDRTRTDSDGDGISDLAEVEAGQDPMDAFLAADGITFQTATAGNAVDVCASDDLLVVATQESGLAIYNVFQGFTPSLVLQSQMPGGLTCLFVACGQQVMAGLSSDTLLLVRRSAPESNEPFTQELVSLPAEGQGATSMVFVGDFALVGYQSGLLSVFRIPTRIGASPIIIMSKFTLLTTGNAGNAVSPITDMAFVDNYLYVVSPSTLHWLEFDLATGQFGAVRRSMYLQMIFQVWHISGPRLFADFSSIIPAHSGYWLIDRKSFSLREARLDDYGVKNVVAINETFGVGAISTSPNSNNLFAFPWSVETVDLQTGGRQIFEYTTPGLAVAVEYHNGLVYTADYSEGIQAINLAMADTTGISPSIEWDGALPGSVAEREVLRLAINANDNVLVNYVDFFVNDVLVFRDGNRPYEFYMTVPDQQGQGSGSLVVVARAIDTGGNVASTTPHVIALVPDTTPPIVVTTIPEHNQPFSAGSVLVHFNEVLSEASIEVLPCLESYGDLCTRPLSAPVSGSANLDNDRWVLTWQSSTLPLPSLPSGFYHIKVNKNISRKFYHNV